MKVDTTGCLILAAIVGTFLIALGIGMMVGK